MKRPLTVLLGSAVAALAAVFYLRGAFRAGHFGFERGRVAAAPAVSRSALTSAAPGFQGDPLLPTRPMKLAERAPTDAGNWVTARPGYQYSHSAAERGGIEPCDTQAVDTSAFAPWVPLVRGKLAAPLALELDAAGRVELVMHLHGDQPVLRELALSGEPFVLYALTLDLDQGYAPLFNGSQLFDAIVADIEKALSQREGKPVRVGRIALSAWSAGFAGAEAVLTSPAAPRVDALILIDGLHAPRQNAQAFKAQLQPFLDYATRAAAGDGFFFVSHSSIDPPDFASTTECAHYLISELGGAPTPVRRSDALGLELVESFSRGNFHVRGYAGNDKADHCAQLGTLRDVFAALGRRWQRPSAVLPR